jgi:hypothetical protein
MAMAASLMEETMNQAMCPSDESPELRSARKYERYSEFIVAQQEALIIEFEREGRDTKTARALLKQMRKTLEALRAEVHRHEQLEHSPPKQENA